MSEYAEAEALKVETVLEKKALDKLAEMQNAHKPAFRAAFDYLAEVWPPSLTVGYFELAARKMVEFANKNNNETLTNKLLMTIYTYLEEAAKAAYNENERSENSDS